MPIQEFRAIVTIKSLDRKGQRLLDRLDLRHHPLRALVPSGAAFGPTRIQIGHRQAPDEISSQAVAAVRHGIGLYKAG